MIGYNSCKMANVWANEHLRLSTAGDSKIETFCIVPIRSLSVNNVGSKSGAENELQFADSDLAVSRCRGVSNQSSPKEKRNPACHCQPIEETSKSGLVSSTHIAVGDTPKRLKWVFSRGAYPRNLGISHRFIRCPGLDGVNTASSPHPSDNQGSHERYISQLSPFLDLYFFSLPPSTTRLESSCERLVVLE